MKVTDLLHLERGTFERAFVLVTCYLVMATAMLTLLDTRSSEAAANGKLRVDERLFASITLEQRESLSAPAEPAAPPPAAAPKARAPIAAPARVPQISPAGRNISSYAGVGTWIDLYDWGKPNSPGISQLVETASWRGVKTIYLQTGRWNLPEDIGGGQAIGEFIDQAHARGIKVVAWYLPGFANFDLDLHRSLAAINFTSTQGRRFDGFAPDIEDPRGVGRNMAAFNAGITEYSRRLRESVPADYALGAITLDARNNERAPDAWAGHPWPDFGNYYDIVLPMTYWTVTKPAPCLAHQVDSGAYMRDVVAKTKALMGKDLPVHPIGGIADCNTGEEVTAYVDVALEQKWHGVSLYDLMTIETHPNRDFIVQQLQRGNELLPKPPPPPARKTKHD